MPVTGAQSRVIPTSPSTEQNLTTFVERTLLSILTSEEQDTEARPATPMEEE